ncbi:hypothetical protein CEXT_578571 [Caerostris extrusa]|uniref:Uncharacterized protein n=1 Tax=Caerostris extrusa TaxID=172846 RepID=A0AAV4S910_CAEEX|nr:hypothetical protein CEXT_578571 [Caerostris extrusa]
MSDRVINIRSKGGGKKKKRARHHGWTPLGIFKARPRECICKFIRLCWPIGICHAPAHATAVGPMGEKGSRGLPAIDRRTWVLVCASTRPPFRFDRGANPLNSSQYCRFCKTSGPRSFDGVIFSPYDIPLTLAFEFVRACVYMHHSVCLPQVPFPKKTANGFPQSSNFNFPSLDPDESSLGDLGKEKYATGETPIFILVPIVER